MNQLFLPFVTAVAMNSFLSLGFGISRIVSAGSGEFPRTVAPALAIVIAGFVVWPFFSLVLAPFSLGYLEMILLVPLSVLISTFSDAVVRKTTASAVDTSAFSAYDGLTYAASFMILRLSVTFVDSVLLASGAAIGYLLCSVMLRAIRERSETEPVPRCLRGAPLMLIAAGFMAILATFLASAGFAALGNR